MEERAARDVVLARAVETAELGDAVLSAEEREQAGRTAAELARWEAAQQRGEATETLFLQKRAELLLDAAGGRAPWVRVLRASHWRPWIGVVLPVTALLLGLATEQVADRRHINVHAFPLLGIVAWNLVVYVVLLLRPLLGRGLGPVRRWLAGAPRAEWSQPGAMTEAGRRFVVEWSVLARRLFEARSARVLHLSAALFAIGALLGLYLRAVAFEYRIGWESTFLQASSVHAILATVLGPAARLLGVAFPTVAAIEAMRMTNGTGGADAGPWIHLYAVTVGLLVIAPRLLLAAWAGALERRRRSALAVDLAAPYFRRALATFAPHSVRVRFAPYSYTLDEAAVNGLERVARRLFGESTRLALRSSIDHGAEDTAGVNLPRSEPDVPLNVAVFSASAIPENENHGRFLDVLRRAGDAPLAALVDVGPYRRRLGNQAGAGERLDERCQAWRNFAAARDVPCSCIDLAAPELAQVETDLARALGSRA